MHRVKSLFFVSLILLGGNRLIAQKQKASVYYFPEANEWKSRQASEAGMNATLLKEAIAFAIDKESKAPRDLEQAHYQTFGREPFGEAIGPFKERGQPSGMIIRNGYIIAEWGDPWRVDMTFSVTKSFLSSVVGLAFDRGLISGIYDTVRHAVPPIEIYQPLSLVKKGDQFGKNTLINLFDTPHNRKITWDHLLRQTSDWEGTLWGKPEWADRPGDKPAEWRTRTRNSPGSVYEYNDVRVNVLALAALNVWRKPLPQVLKENIMDPIGASSA